MDFINWLQVYGSVLSLIASIILVLVTGIYVYFTKRILDSTIRQSNLVSNPVIGIKVGEMHISEVFGPSRRNLSIGLNLINVGNAPAIDVLVDSEIVFSYTNINGENTIPARFEPYSIPFIRPGEEISEENFHNPSFGNQYIIHLFDDERECNRLNINRIETNPEKESYNSSLLRVCLYYKNNLGQHFESTYETHFRVGDHIKKAGDPLDFIPPKDNESCQLHEINVPRSKFHSGPIKEKIMNRNIKRRNLKRNLCGW